MRSMRLTAPWLALVGLALAGCLAPPTHHCDTADDCASGEQCLPVAVGDLRCARDSGSCDSGLAWTDDAGDVAGSCVDGAPPLDWNPCIVQAQATGRTDACTTAVCALDARCCTREWSDTCVNLADEACGLTCGAVAAFVGTDETRVAVWDGSDYVTLWGADDVAGYNVTAAAWGDYDGDGRPDLATCEWNDSSSIRVYHDDGDTFTRVARVSTGGVACADVAWVDVDGDGALDVVASGAYAVVWLRDDAGLWSTSVQSIATGFVLAMDWADIAGDGHMDAALARYEDSLQVMEGSGGALTPWYDSGDGASQPRYQAVSLGEVDLVGGLDLLVGGEGILRVVSNTDPNGFAAGTPLLDVPTPGDVPAALLADVEEDGDLDAVVFTVAGPLRVYRNDYDHGAGGGFTGTPLWTSATAPFASTNEGAMALGDVDGDRHLDLVACAASECQLWQGAGDGTFTSVWSPGGARVYHDVALTGDWR